MNIRHEQLESGVHTLVFDKPDSAANTFDRATMNELNEHLDDLASNGDVKGLILTSAKPTIFIAGADIKELFDPNAGPEEIRRAVRQGQEVFNRIADLPYPTVAAIHGAALGGGCEISLACDYRVASDDKSTRIGLPETALGILPAWGGSTRLPRLIGLRKALDAILGGKRLAARQARKYGLVDEVVPRESLIEMSLRLIGKGKAKPRSHGFENSSIGARIAERFARKGVEEKTRGHYPAVPRALEVVVNGLRVSVEESLHLEVEAVLDLAQTDVCRNLVNVFFLQERSKRFRYALPDGVEPDTRPIERVAVIGAGVMGAGIAQWSSARGQAVTLKDISDEQMLKGLAGIAKVYQDATRRRVFTRSEARHGLDRIYPTTHPVSLKRTDLVIEAAVENMDIKKKLFMDLAETSRDDTILATNTSALSISDIAEAVPNPGRVIGIHYFNPVHRMQLVEVVVGTATDPVVVDRTVRFVQASGKFPVVVKDSPGFVVNRILMPYLTEAGFLFENGADPLVLDNVMLDFGMPMGPIRLMDEVGVDVCSHVAHHQAARFGERMPVSTVLETMLEAGQLGRKSGSGFYVYRGKRKKAPPEPNPKVAEWVQSTTHRDAGRDALRRRMVLMMVNEAARCLEEGLVEGAEDIDFAMIFGTGFAPFRGGPLRYADAQGIRTIVDAMSALSQEGEARFAPCASLADMATDGRTFYP